MRTSACWVDLCWANEWLGRGTLGLDMAVAIPCYLHWRHGVSWLLCGISWEETFSKASDMCPVPLPTPGEYHTHNGPSTPAKEGDADRPHRASSDGKLRGRSKRSSDPSPAGNNEIEVSPDCLFDLVNVISICGQGRRVRDRVLCKSIAENGHKVQ